MAYTNPETGKEMQFHEIVVAILVEEHNRTKEDALRLVTAYPQVITNGIMGSMNYRATAMALEMKEGEE